MNINELTNIVGHISKQLPNINSYYSEDIYDMWNNEEVEYSSLVFNVTSAAVDNNTLKLDALLYYGDRLMEGETNKKEIFDDAVKYISVVINTLKKNYEPLEIDDYTVNLFTQRFADQLAGGYAELAISIPNAIGECGFDDTTFDQSEWKEIKITKNGDYEVLATPGVKLLGVKIVAEIPAKLIEYIAGDNIDITDRVISAEVGATKNHTYAELIKLREDNKLVPGQWYRLTDYVCTADIPEARAVEHPFDIILLATDPNKFDENCFAAVHEGDTYFANNKLESWQIKYTLDNNKKRFNWADEVNGKGVIYRLIDEFNNDICYDFKGMQFERNVEWFNAHKKWCNDILGKIPTESLWFYTFDAAGTDLSLNPNCYENYIAYNWGELNFNILHAGVSTNSWVYDIKLDTSCHHNTFGGKCTYVDYSGTFKCTLGGKCAHITMGEECENNTLGNNCSYVDFVDACWDNILGDNQWYHHFDRYCETNTIGDGCQGFDWGTNCRTNKVGAASFFIRAKSWMRNCVFGDRTLGATFGDRCAGCKLGTYNQGIIVGFFSTLILGNNGFGVTVGDECTVTLGNSCKYDKIGNKCVIKGGNSVRACSFENSSNVTLTGDTYNSCSFGEDCNVTITPKGTGTLQKLAVLQGATGTHEVERGLKGNLEIGLRKNGDIRLYYPAEMIESTIPFPHADLKTLMTAKKLISGQQYRITDYTASTKAAGTKASTDQFDIILTAIGEDKFDENVRIARHEGDKHFVNAALENWNAKYIIDNDADRYNWATPDGKGVIYYLKDEFGNEVSYDFKNILFERSVEWLTTNEQWTKGEFITVPAESMWFYTFSFYDKTTKVITDYSLTSKSYDNIILSNGRNPQSLNNAVFVNNDNTLSIDSNRIHTDSYNLTFGNCCEVNIIGEACHDIIFEHGNAANEIKVGGNNLYFGANGTGNKFDIFCGNIKIGAKGLMNKFDAYCNTLTLGGNNRANYFEEGNRNTTLGDNCFYNQFGPWAKNNKLANSCMLNDFGQQCTGYTLGYDCRENHFYWGGTDTASTLGSKCWSNIIHNHGKLTCGNNCQYNYIDADAKVTLTGNNYCHCRFEQGCIITLNADAGTSNVSYINARAGLNGTFSVKRGLNYQVNLGSGTSQASTTITINPNTVNKWSGVNELNITLSNPDSAEIYILQFTTGDNPDTTKFIINGVEWYRELDIQPNTQYEVTVLNKLAVGGAF